MKFSSVQLRKQNSIYVAIGSQFHIPRSTIISLLLLDKQSTVAVIEKRTRRPINLQPRCRRMLLLLVKTKGFFPMQRIAPMFRTAKCDSVCENSIPQFCHDNGVRNYSAVPKQYFTNNGIAS